jgi:predicted SprT family Zn-dependent metalloprotease
LSLEKVKAKVEQIQLTLEAMGYPPFDIHVEVMQLPRGVAGMANIKTDCIRISTDYLAEYQDDVLARTVPHETCHLYVKKYFSNAKQYHGKDFRMLMTRLDADPSTRHQMILRNAEVNRRLVTRYVYETLKSREIVHLTKHQHSLALRGAVLMVKDEKIVYCNEAVKL